MIEVTPLWMLAVILFLIIFPAGMIWLIRYAREEENPERNYSALLYAGNRAQLEKLNQYQRKGGWDHISMFTLFDYLEEEVQELHMEIFNSGTMRNVHHIRH